MNTKSNITVSVTHEGKTILSPLLNIETIFLPAPAKIQTSANPAMISMVMCTVIIPNEKNEPVIVTLPCDKCKLVNVSINRPLDQSGYDEKLYTVVVK